MGKSLRFCYKADKKLKLIEDENGKPAEAFLCLKANNVATYDLSEEAYKKLEIEFRKVVANKLSCDIDQIIPITINEYLDSTETEI